MAHTTSRRSITEASVTLEFTFDPTVCSAVAAALRPEARRGAERFVETDVEVDGGRLRLRLQADDLADLRAGVNSYFNLVRVSSETLSALRRP